jgi:hypothetical protein
MNRWLRRTMVAPAALYLLGAVGTGFLAIALLCDSGCSTNPANIWDAVYHAVLWPELWWRLGFQISFLGLLGAGLAMAAPILVPIVLLVGIHAGRR